MEDTLPRPEDREKTRNEKRLLRYLITESDSKVDIVGSAADLHVSLIRFMKGVRAICIRTVSTSTITAVVVSESTSDRKFMGGNEGDIGATSSVVERRFDESAIFAVVSTYACLQIGDSSEERAIARVRAAS